MTTSTQTQLRRGTSAQVAAMTPALGEVVVDTTNKRLKVGDGSTAGGTAVPNASDVQGQKLTYATVGGTGDAITLTNIVPITAYVAGQKFQFKATASNTTATTVAVDGLSAKNVKRMVSGSLAALGANTIVNGGLYEITYDGTQFQIGVPGGGFSVVKQAFTSSGTYTPTAGMLYCIVEVLGAGAGGRAGSASGSGSGGGAGSYAKGLISAATIGASQTVTIGAGGSSSNNGGTSSLGSLISCPGGTTGSNSSAPVLGGAGGTAPTGGDIAVTGRRGGYSVSSSFSGEGGSTIYGTGGTSDTGSGASAGTGYGSGGSGGVGNGTAGGAGKDGLVYITEFCSA